MRKAKPSKTARKVALNVVALGAREGMEDILPQGLADATAELLVKSGVAGRRVVRFAGSRVAVGIYLAFDWMIPGQFEAFGHRKAYFEREVRAAVDAGAKQVLALGAGYDLLGWRLAPEFPDVQFFEIDHPATARHKAKGIAAMGTRANLHLLAEDLGERELAAVLQANETWDCTVQTVFLAEALLMYLQPEAVGALLRQCASTSGKGSRMVFSYLGSSETGRPEAGPWTCLLMWLLKVSGEPWLWSIQPEELEHFLQRNNWSLAQDTVLSPKDCGIEYYGLAVR